MKFRRSLILLFIAFAGVVSMTSCVKNYTCYCNISYSGVPGLPDSTTIQYSIKDTQSGASSKCSAASATYNNPSDPNEGNVKTVENCYLY